ncbi:transglycosylase domain-containing protein [Paenibacillus chibensis]|uniref:transglycosylase domain-containing protein n=1 Tax=Paenibacillus chibensis TaxID=59846 RepID=UPI000FD6C56C|nr:PBP1A family penicillin-binding protein [Paenibacillus chibensis]MEC0370722.1 PBP1A family penicillin-binding protein [Paenibacillus chibensis]
MNSIQGKAWRKMMGSLYFSFDLAVIGAVVVLAGLFYVHSYGGIVVGRHPEKLVLPQSSILVASDGTELRKIPLPESGYRLRARLEDMPELLLDTFLAVEDRSFYGHEGLDYKGIARAVYTNSIHMRISEGGSTITQQLVRNLYLNRDQTLLRKLNEASIALALEKRLSKHDILELYLNEIYMGDGQYGIKAAAEHYFGVTDLKKLSVAQIASLAGIPKGPSIYNPLYKGDLPVQRRSVVLGIMKRQGLISHEEMMTAMNTKYQPPAQASNTMSGASYMDAALREAAQRTGKTLEDLKTGGYTIVTGMNSSAQSALEHTFSNPEFFPPDGKDQQVEAAMVVMDHRTGEVVALTGGRNPAAGSLNRAVIDARQPGSAFKPIIDYGPALESGKFSPDSMLQDRKIAYGSYKPQNLSGIYQGQMTMRQAMQQSVNAPAVWLLQQVGITKATQFAAKLGISLAPEDANLSIALGGVHAGVSPLKMAQAYSVFASGGIYREAHLVRQVTDSKGRVLYAYQPDGRQVISRATADSMTGMLRAVVNEGTGMKARMSRPVAGKTGTTQLGLPGVSSRGNRDLWFVGYTPEWTGAVWMGFDRTDADHYMTAGSGKAAALFSAVMSRALGR